MNKWVREERIYVENGCKGEPIVRCGWQACNNYSCKEVTIRVCQTNHSTFLYCTCSSLFLVSLFLFLSLLFTRWSPLFISLLSFLFPHLQILPIFLFLSFSSCFLFVSTFNLPRHTVRTRRPSILHLNLVNLPELANELRVWCV